MSAEVVPTNVLVAARGHDVLPNGDLVLGESTVQRVITAARFFMDHEVDFREAAANGTGGMLVMSGGHATMAAGIEAPPYELREGVLMKMIGGRLGIPAKHMAISAAPTTTLEVVLRPYEEGHWANRNLSPSNPLGIVTQASQYPRLKWYTERVMRLPEGTVQLIEAPGEEDPAIVRDERLALMAMRAMAPFARTPYALRRGERRVERVTNILQRLHILKRPGNRYLKLEGAAQQ